MLRTLIISAFTYYLIKTIIVLYRFIKELRRELYLNWWWNLENQDGSPNIREFQKDIESGWLYLGFFQNKHIFSNIQRYMMTTFEYPSPYCDLGEGQNFQEKLSSDLGNYYILWIITDDEMNSLRSSFVGHYFSQTQKIKHFILPFSTQPSLEILKLYLPELEDFFKDLGFNHYINFRNYQNTLRDPLIRDSGFPRIFKKFYKFSK